MTAFATQLVANYAVNSTASKVVNDFSAPISYHCFEYKKGDMTLDKNRDNALAMNDFLASVERRAYRMAEIATGNSDDALDIVQDTMLALVKNYSHKMPQDWEPLFYRILQSRIRDWYRRSTVRNRLLDWLGLANSKADTRGHAESDTYDPIQAAEDIQGKNPEQMASNSDAATALDIALKQLSLRQQQAFLLRNWQGMNVNQTAAAMACSPGSVKTHYSRAVHRLRELLEEHYEAGR